ncbi:hypothetical protein D3C74_476940 [compost metagenome]
MLHRREHIAQRILITAQRSHLLKQVQIELDHQPLTIGGSQEIMHIAAIDELNLALLHPDRGLIYSQI